MSDSFRHSWKFLNLYFMNNFQLSRQNGSTEITFLCWLQGWRNLLNEKQVIRNFIKTPYLLQYTVYREYRNDIKKNLYNWWKELLSILDSSKQK